MFLKQEKPEMDDLKKNGSKGKLLKIENIVKKC